MKESIFRKESLERVNSPGQLNRYIRVADPGTWIILAAIVVLLLGAIVWGLFGELETTVSACVVADDAAATCYVALQDAKAVQPGMQVRAGDQLGRITAVSFEPADLPGGAQVYLSAQSGCAAQAEFDALPAGIYAAEVIVEAVAPISFVIQ